MSEDERRPYAGVCGEGWGRVVVGRRAGLVLRAAEGRGGEERAERGERGMLGEETFVPGIGPATSAISWRV